MAGGNSFTKNPQKGIKYNSVFNNTEIFNDSATPSKAPTILDGILRPGETINFNQEIKTPEKPKFDNYLQKEQSLFVNENKNEVIEQIEDIKNKIKSLIPNTENLNQDIANIPLQNIPETNNYQLNFLERIKSYIIDFKKDASDSNSWADFYNHRKNKRNAYWNKAKSGGTKYSENGEHSAARSAN